MLGHVTEVWPPGPASWGCVGASNFRGGVSSSFCCQQPGGPPPSHLTLACLERMNLDSVVQPELLGLHCGRSPGSGAAWWSVSTSHATGWVAGRRPVSGPHGWSRAHEHLSHLMLESPENLRKHCTRNVQSRVLWAAFCKPSENLSPWSFIEIPRNMGEKPGEAAQARPSGFPGGPAWGPCGLAAART